MKIRVLPGVLSRYYDAGGGWSEDTPDENAVDIELSAVPMVGQFITYVVDERRVIARVDDVVLVDGSIPHVFVTEAN